MPQHSQDGGYPTTILTVLNIGMVGNPPPILMFEKLGTYVLPSSIMGEDIYFYLYLYIMYYYHTLVLSKWFRHFSWVAAQA